MDVSGQLHTPVVLPLGNNPRYPLDRRLGGTQSRYGRYGEKNNFFPLHGIEPRLLDLPALSLVGNLLSYPGSQKVICPNNKIIITFSLV
jgi:hypothetical protein